MVGQPDTLTAGLELRIPITIRVLNLEAPELVRFLMERHNKLSFVEVKYELLGLNDTPPIERIVRSTLAVLSDESEVGKYTVEKYEVDGTIVRQFYTSQDGRVLSWNERSGICDDNGDVPYQ